MTRTVIYRVHGCDESSPCRRRPTCERAAWSGFVETRTHAHYLAVFPTRAAAERAAADTLTLAQPIR